MTPLVPTLDISEGLSEKVGKIFNHGPGWCELEAGESFVVERFWERYLVGGDTLSISEPRLGMGGLDHRGRGDSLPQLAAGGSNKGSVVHTL